MLGSTGVSAAVEIRERDGRVARVDVGLQTHSGGVLVTQRCAMHAAGVGMGLLLHPHLFMNIDFIIATTLHIRQIPTIIRQSSVSTLIGMCKNQRTKHHPRRAGCFGYQDPLHCNVNMSPQLRTTSMRCFTAAQTADFRVSLLSCSTLRKLWKLWG